MRPCYQWRLRSRTIELGRRTLIMGVLNVTPDSFSDGGRFFSRGAAVEHALRMLAEGADIIDVGGESTRPGTRVVPELTAEPGVPPAPSPAEATREAVPEEQVSAEEELRRILRVIEDILRAAPEAIISVDTYKAEVARAAVAVGAQIVNDVSALTWDAGMAPAVAKLACGVVLMHTRGRPEQWRTLPPLGAGMVDLVRRELAQASAAAERAGILRQAIVLDPGFGFGKNFEDNYPLLARFDELHRLGYPLLAGTSRKSFIGRTVSRTGEPVAPECRLSGTLATVAASVLKGAHIVRVHDVAPARDVAAVCDEILQADLEAR